MKMMGVSEGIITRLYDEGLIKSIPDLYRLRDYEDTIKDMDGFGDKSYWNIVTSIENALHEVTL
jgi:DNA ligase (NAD+)